MLCTHYFFSVAKKSREICSVCSRGFQLRREPPLHLLCSSCGKPTHTRCVRKLNRSLSSFLCQKCNPGPEHSSSYTRSENGGGEASKSGCPTSSLVQSSSVSQAPEVSSRTLGATVPVGNLGAAFVNAKVCTSGPSSARGNPDDISELGVEDTAILLNEPEGDFDARMESLGFKRSPSQPNTIGDGACGVRALCDQLSLCSNDPMFGPEEHVLARRYTATQAKSMVKRQELDSCFFEPNVSDWCMRMSRNSEFIDNIFLLIFAQVQERDIVVIPVHKESAAGNDFAGNGDFRWIKGMLEFELG